PADQRGEAHEDGVDVAAALESEESAPIVDEVELHVAAAPAELLGPIALRPGHAPASFDDGNVRGQERVADALHELVLLRAAEIVEEDSTHSALRVAVGDEEILAGPLREARVALGPAGLLQHAVEVRGVLRERTEWGEIHAAAEPRRVAGLEVTHVHVDDGHKRVLRMQDQRDAGGEEGFAGDLARSGRTHVVAGRRRHGARRRRGEARPLHRGEVAARFLEQLAAQLAHLPTASTRPLPGGTAKRRAGSFDLLQPGHDAVPQLAETLLHLLAEALHSPLLSSGAGLESER